MRALQDRYGFFFWLRWIVSFAGSFAVSAGAWTLLLTRLFGPIQGGELVLTWTASVFGTWFLLVIPFMRKKEQIWKRLNEDQEKSVDAWFTGMGFFLGLFVASAVFWTWALKKRLFPDTPGFDPLWLKAVFGTWMLILIPLLVWMYRKADSIFEKANARQTYIPNFKVHWIAPEKRQLPEELVQQVKKWKPTIPGGHLVNARLKNGEVLKHLFVMNGREVAGIYDPPVLDFDVSEFEALSVLEEDFLPQFDETKWVRFNIPPDNS